MHRQASKERMLPLGSLLLPWMAPCPGTSVGCLQRLSDILTGEYQLSELMLANLPVCLWLM